MTLTVGVPGFGMEACEGEDRFREVYTDGKRSGK
jgi:hypothetical protein